MEIVYFWIMKVEQKAVHEEGNYSSNTIVDWYNYCREHAMVVCIDKSEVLGGEGKIVEIDESKFGKRKYHRGHHVEGQWVFGGVERDSDPVKIFAEPVEKRDKETFLPIIKKWIKPGTTIISDFWKAYDCLSEEDMNHLKVNHSICFVDRITGAHTNTIEGSWNIFKR